MIKGIGIDIVELSRIEQITQKQSSFIKRVLTENERLVFQQLSRRRQVEYLGGRFCCKEAFSKAWGTGISGVGFQEIEILSNSYGAPEVTKSPHKGKVFVSISHTNSLAIAQIILEE